MATVSMLSRLAMAANNKKPHLPGVPSFCAQPLVNHRDLIGRFETIWKETPSQQDITYSGQLAICLGISEDISDGYGSRMVAIPCEVTKRGIPISAVDMPSEFDDNTVAGNYMADMIQIESLQILYQVCCDTPLLEVASKFSHLSAGLEKGPDHSQDCLYSQDCLVLSAFVLNSFHKVFNGFAEHQDYVNLVGRLWKMDEVQKNYRLSSSTRTDVAVLDCFRVMQDTVYVAKMMMASLGVFLPIVDGLTRTYAANLAQMAIKPMNFETFTNGWSSIDRFRDLPGLDPYAVVMSGATSIQLVYPESGTFNYDVVESLVDLSASLQKQTSEVSVSDFRSYAIRFLSQQKNSLMSLSHSRLYKKVNDHRVLTDSEFTKRMDALRYSFVEGFFNPIEKNTQAEKMVMKYQASYKAIQGDDEIAPWRRLVNTLKPTPKKPTTPTKENKQKAPSLTPARIITDRNNFNRSHKTGFRALTLIIRVPTVWHDKDPGGSVDHGVPWYLNQITVMRVFLEHNGIYTPGWKFVRDTLGLQCLYEQVVFPGFFPSAAQDNWASYALMFGDGFNRVKFHLLNGFYTALLEQSPKTKHRTLGHQLLEQWTQVCLMDVVNFFGMDLPVPVWWQPICPKMSEFLEPDKLVSEHPSHSNICGFVILILVALGKSIERFPEEYDCDIDLSKLKTKCDMNDPQLLLEEDFHNSFSDTDTGFLSQTRNKEKKRVSVGCRKGGTDSLLPRFRFRFNGMLQPIQSLRQVIIQLLTHEDCADTNAFLKNLENSFITSEKKFPDWGYIFCGEFPEFGNFVMSKNPEMNYNHTVLDIYDLLVVLGHVKQREQRPEQAAASAKSATKKKSPPKAGSKRKAPAKAASKTKSPTKASGTAKVANPRRSPRKKPKPDPPQVLFVETDDEETELILEDEDGNPLIDAVPTSGTQPESPLVTTETRVTTPPSPPHHHSTAHYSFQEEPDPTSDISTKAIAETDKPENPRTEEGQTLIEGELISQQIGKDLTQDEGELADAIAVHEDNRLLASLKEPDETLEPTWKKNEKLSSQQLLEYAIRQPGEVHDISSAPHHYSHEHYTDIDLRYKWSNLKYLKSHSFYTGDRTHKFLSKAVLQRIQYHQTKSMQIYYDYLSTMRDTVHPTQKDIYSRKPEARCLRGFHGTHTRTQNLPAYRPTNEPPTPWTQAGADMTEYLLTQDPTVFFNKQPFPDDPEKQNITATPMCGLDSDTWLTPTMYQDMEAEEYNEEMSLGDEGNKAESEDSDEKEGEEKDDDEDSFPPAASSHPDSTGDRNAPADNPFDDDDDDDDDEDQDDDDKKPAAINKTTNESDQMEGSLSGTHDEHLLTALNEISQETELFTIPLIHSPAKARNLFPISNVPVANPGLIRKPALPSKAVPPRTKTSIFVSPIHDGTKPKKKPKSYQAKNLRNSTISGVIKKKIKQKRSSTPPSSYWKRIITNKNMKEPPSMNFGLLKPPKTHTTPHPKAKPFSDSPDPEFKSPSDSTRSKVIVSSNSHSQNQNFFGMGASYED